MLLVDKWKAITVLSEVIKATARQPELKPLEQTPSKKESCRFHNLRDPEKHSKICPHMYISKIDAVALDLNKTNP